MDFVKIIAVMFSGFIFFTVIELIRRNHLKERYSLIWLAAATVLMLFSMSRSLLHSVSSFLGIYYPPSFLFLLAIGFLLIILLHLSSIVSRLSEENKQLAQEIGILKTLIQQQNTEKK